MTGRQDVRDLTAALTAALLAAATFVVSISGAHAQVSEGSAPGQCLAPQNSTETLTVDESY